MVESHKDTKIIPTDLEQACRVYTTHKIKYPAVIYSCSGLHALLSKTMLQNDITLIQNGNSVMYNVEAARSGSVKVAISFSCTDIKTL